MARDFLLPVCRFRSAWRGAGRVASVAYGIIEKEGAQVLRIDSEGYLFATPAKHPLSQRLIKSHTNTIVGQYNAKAKVDNIRSDIIATAASIKR